MPLQHFLDDVYLKQYPYTRRSVDFILSLLFFTIALISLFYLVVIKKERYNIKEEKFNIIGGICETAGQFFLCLRIKWKLSSCSTFNVHR